MYPDFRLSNFLPVLLLFAAVLGLLPCSQVIAQNNSDEAAESGSANGAEEPVEGDAESGINSPPEPAQPIDVVPTADDDQIQTRLLRILQASRWFQDVDVEVDEGIVFLSGTTSDDRYRQWAGDLARRTQDVVAVVNNVVLDDDAELGRSFDQIGDSLKTLWADFLNRLPLIIAGIVVLILTYFVNLLAVALVRRASRRSRLRTSLVDLFAQLTTCLVWIAGIMVSAIIVFPGMTPARLLTVLGLSSVAIGFAFKDIFENFFAGILILWRFPFDKGDYIESDPVAGKVEDITIRMTKIRQVDGQLIVVPNAMLFKQPVYVLTSRKIRRVTVICGVAYDEDVDESRGVIQQAVSSCDTVADDQPVEIFAQEFASSSINFEVTWWTGSTPLEIRRSRDQVVAAVKRALDEAGIEIPFPYRTLTFKEPLTMHSESQSGDSSS